MSERRARFAVGQLVDHRLFGYRGVVFDVNATFELDDEWYEQVARTRPPKDQPWYHVLVHDSDGVTYVAERNLEAASTTEPVRHPLVTRFFGPFAAGRYAPRARLN
jgi:heat shock protein HspQ